MATVTAARIESDQQRVVDAMRTIEELLDAPSLPPRKYALRSLRPGDIG